MRNFVDYFVTFLLIMCIIAFIYPYFSRHAFEKDIFTTVEDALERVEGLDEEGFFYTLTITGWWNSDNSKFIEEVFLTDSGEHEMEVIRKNGTIVTVGNLNNLKTEIRTSKTEINIKNREVYSFEIEFDIDFGELESMINDHPVQSVINTAISGTIFLENFEKMGVIEEKKLNDELRKKFFYCKRIEINGKDLYLEYFSAKYLKDLKEVYNEKIKGKIKVYVRY